MITWRTAVVAVAMANLGLPAALRAQNGLDSVIVRATDAWVQHRIRDLVEGSDTIRLRIPGVTASAAVRAGQAVRLLGDYLDDARELGLDLRGIRHVAADHAYAEFGRRYQVRGTADVSVETVFLGYRQLGGAWRLREVRIAR